MKKLFLIFLFLSLSYAQAHATTCDDATTIASTARAALDNLKTNYTINATKIETERDIRLGDIDADITEQNAKMTETKAIYDKRLFNAQTSLTKAKERLTIANAKITEYEKAYTECQSMTGKDCSYKQSLIDKKKEAIEKINARIASLNSTISNIPAKKDAAVAVIQNKIDALNSDRKIKETYYSNKLSETKTTLQAKIDAQETVVNTANTTMQSLCGNAGAGKK